MSQTFEQKVFQTARQLFVESSDNYTREVGGGVNVFDRDAMIEDVRDYLEAEYMGDVDRTEQIVEIINERVSEISG